MKTISSRLGFGLSSIAGSGNRQHQERLIKTAIDAGITHFDVAPYYGSGDAEKILGSILKSCSEKVTITTKFGLVPLSGGLTGSLLRTALRPVFRQMRSLKQFASTIVRRTHQQKKLQFAKGDLLASIDASIRNIGREVDILLLHDTDITFSGNPDLLEELERIKSQGKTCFTGISGEADTVLTLVKSYPQTYGVAQLENSLRRPAPVSQLLDSGASVITHRAIQGGLGELRFLMKSRPKFMQVWNREIGIDATDNETIAGLLIELALFENKGGPVLFSTTNPKHIRKVASVLDSPRLREEEYLAVRSIFSELYIEESE